MATIKYNIKGARNLDLIAARAELKQFRRDVAQLKKRGLLTKDKYDARSVVPTKYLKSVIKSFADVLSGSAQSVKIPVAKKKYYAEQGYKTKNNRVVVPVLKNETAYFAGGVVRMKTVGSNGSITRIPLELDRNDISNWENIIRARAPKLKKNERLSFQLFGNNSHRSFIDAQDMIDYLNNYPTITGDSSPEQIAEFIQNIVVFRFDRNDIPEPSPEAKRKKEGYAERNREWYNRRLNRMTPHREARYHAERADKERARREKLKTEKPELYAKRKEAEKIRAQKLRDKKKSEKSEK